MLVEWPGGPRSPGRYPCRVSKTAFEKKKCDFNKWMQAQLKAEVDGNGDGTAKKEASNKKHKRVKTASSADMEAMKKRVSTGGFTNNPELMAVLTKVAAVAV